MKEAQQQRLTNKYDDGLRQEQLVDFFAMWMCQRYVGFSFSFVVDVLVHLGAGSRDSVRSWQHR